MSAFTVVVTVDGTEHSHPYAYENDARYQMAVWQGEGYPCRLEVLEPPC